MPASGVQLASVVMLLISSTGVFLPLEVALNRVWGVTRNRSYFMNQLVSLGLAAGIGTVALLSVAITAAQQSILQFLFFGHINNVAFVFVSHWLLQISAAVASILLFFLIYWILPNRKLPVRAVLPTAIVIGLSWELAKMLYIAGAALDGPSLGIRPLLRLRELDVVGIRDRPAVAGGRTLLGFAPRSASRLPGRSGTRQGRKTTLETCPDQEGRASPSLDEPAIERHVGSPRLRMEGRTLQPPSEPGTLLRQCHWASPGREQREQGSRVGSAHHCNIS